MKKYRVGDRVLFGLNECKLTRVSYASDTVDLIIVKTDVIKYNVSMYDIHHIEDSRKQKMAKEREMSSSEEDYYL